MKSMQKSSVRTQSLEESAFRIIEEEILSGAIGKGESLTELGLSAKLGISRTPVRGVLTRLEEEGLVEILPNRRAVVRGIDTDALIDIYQVRKRLEGMASALAAENITGSELAALKDSVELSEFYIRKSDTEQIKNLDTAFHLTIYRASGNPQLEKILSDFHRKIKTYRKLSISSPGRLECSVREHREILAAIESGNARLADELTSTHVERALENLLIALEKDKNGKDGAESRLGGA